MFKKKTYWLNSLTILTLATTNCVNPAIANEISPTTTTDYFNGDSSIEIFVPPPENPTIPPRTPIPQQRGGGVCSALLEPSINAIIGKYPNNWGIEVESLTDGTVLYSHNADKFFIPASNTKIFTSAAALQRLGPSAAIGSKSLKDWITFMNLVSNNYYAETLMRRVGGPAEAKAALSELGIDPNGYRLADGSGLSRRNVATPRTITSILRAMYYSPQKDVFYGSLPVAGVSGTLRNRMRQTAAQGAVFAKTGTLSGVRALSGYMNHPQYGMLVFSIVANYPFESRALVSSIDKIVLQLSMLTPCE
ncbi:D-alanyl-D-alanine carboxypeptidase/D-alanyl-D-alanine endopeptidase [Gloeothece verrucosa]|uniref:Peptidase S13 D-Ala-D-Ala carboxypeptidase C n=1 Tax=Gloeothece verrucosa (strain PCC 7822) TaxID=497965 RepID=E0U6V9_GLOV7|nr:D-alanyl-D-alanine carboxypeptidase/D-alanyl-D-alanine-endopeptidase [Gloeothece verrucosa]ADN15996.1 peptidase S13 D-Ala-D-Ala carboxypeptidase C [Gloeothece verrucosa PCC 7822]